MRKLRSFPILAGDSPDSYQYTCSAFRYGHIVARYKAGTPARVRSAETQGFSLLTLGFHDFDYDALDAESVERLKDSQGEFVALLLDIKDETVHVVNDRFSSRLFYWYQQDDVTAFSSNLAFLIHLIDVPCKPDITGWLQIFSYSHTLAQRTNVEGIRRLPPATHLRITETGVESRRYWRLKHQARRDLDPVEHAERTFDALRRSTAMRAGMGRKGFVSLSGGLDSRAVAGALPPDADFYFFTFGGPAGSAETADAAAARRIAAILHREHRVEPLQHEHVSCVAEDAIRLTGGLTTIQHPAKTFQNLREMLAGPGFKMGGGPGDSLAGAFASGSIHNVRPVMTERQVYKFIFHRKRFSRELLAQIWRRDVVEAFYPSLDESMNECFSTLSGETAAHRLSAWAMIYRQPAFTFTSPIHNHPDVTEASPHLGYDYVDCMLQLPAEWIYQKNFYKFMIWHCLPELRDVVYANTGRTLPGCIQSYALSPRKKLFSAIERCIPAPWIEQWRRSRVRPSPRRTFEYALLHNDTKLLLEIREMLHSYHELADLLDIEACDAFVDRFSSGTPVSPCPANDAEMLGGLASLCYWHRHIARQTHPEK